MEFNYTAVVIKKELNKFATDMNQLIPHHNSLIKLITKLNLHNYNGVYNFTFTPDKFELLISDTYYSIHNYSNLIGNLINYLNGDQDLDGIRDIVPKIDINSTPTDTLDLHIIDGECSVDRLFLLNELIKSLLVLFQLAGLPERKTIPTFAEAYSERILDQLNFDIKNYNTISLQLVRNVLERLEIINNELGEV